MLPSTSSRLRQGLTHVTDTGRCPTPCPNPTEVARLGQLFLCCSRSGASPSSRACSVLFPALRLSRTAVCAATELSVRCSQDLPNLRTASVLRPDRRGEPVVTTGWHSQRRNEDAASRHSQKGQCEAVGCPRKEVKGKIIGVKRNTCLICHFFVGWQLPQCLHLSLTHP